MRSAICLTTEIFTSVYLVMDWHCEDRQRHTKIVSERLQLSLLFIANIYYNLRCKRQYVSPLLDQQMEHQERRHRGIGQENKKKVYYAPFYYVSL